MSLMWDMFNFDADHKNTIFLPLLTPKNGKKIVFFNPPSKWLDFVISWGLKKWCFFGSHFGQC